MQNFFRNKFIFVCFSVTEKCADRKGLILNECTKNSVLLLCAQEGGFLKSHAQGGLSKRESLARETNRHRRCSPQVVERTYAFQTKCRSSASLSRRFTPPLLRGFSNFTRGHQNASSRFCEKLRELRRRTTSIVGSFSMTLYCRKYIYVRDSLKKFRDERGIFERYIRLTEVIEYN